MTSNKVTEEELARNQAERPGAKRVTLQSLKDNIAGVYFTNGLDMASRRSPIAEEDLRTSLSLLTVCVLVLKNGFTIIGKSACADPSMYNEDVGQRLSQEDAEKQIWPLMGYALKQELYLASLSGSSSGSSLGSQRSPSDQELLQKVAFPKPAGSETYIGTKVIYAYPMTRLAYTQLRGWDLPSDEDGNDPGYLVEYADGIRPNVSGYFGYVSWSPAEVFEKSYRQVSENEPIEDSFKARARQELSELTDKIGKLDAFISGKVHFQALSSDEQNDLIAQANAMRDYQRVLQNRVNRF